MPTGPALMAVCSLAELQHQARDLAQGIGIQSGYARMQWWIWKRNYRAAVMSHVLPIHAVVETAAASVVERQRVGSERCCCLPYLHGSCLCMVQAKP